MSEAQEQSFQSSSDLHDSVIESESSYYSEYDEDDHMPFFADATLDLEEAQGIAPTPDAVYKSLVNPDISVLEKHHPVPNLGDDARQGLQGVGVGVSFDAEASIKSSDIPRPSRMLTPSRSTSTASQGGTMNLQRITSQQNSYDNGSVSSRRNPASYTVHAISNDGINSNGMGMGMESTQGGQNESTFNINNPPIYRSRPPHRPRDTKWTTIFFITIPFLLLPYFLSPSESDLHLHQIHKADIYIILTLGITILLSRVFYLSRGGGEGEDQRHVAGQILLVANIVSCGILPLVFISFYNLRASGFVYALTLGGLAYWMIRDIFFVAKLFKSGRYIVEGVNDGQRAFFRMLVNASLDILSRSLRCQSFYRVIVFVLTLQLGVLLCLRKALEYAIAMNNPFNVCWIFIVAIIGYWCVNVFIRFLGYLSCGGVTAWFAQQDALMRDMEQMRRREEGDDFVEDELELQSQSESQMQMNSTMPEAYGNVDASAYSNGIEFDEGMDDDYGDDNVLSTSIADITGIMGIGMSTNSRNTKSFSGEGEGRGRGHSRSTFRRDGGGNVKSFCRSAVGSSFGSIVHCAIVGGAANFAWTFLRTVESMASLSSRFAPLRPGNFRGMSVGDDDGNGTLQDRFMAKWRRLITASRAFVRNRNDLALCHVAAYYKSYSRAANDVMAVIDVSGTYRTCICMHASNHA